MKKIDVFSEYAKYCEEKNIEFKLDESIKSFDDTTLFCPAGMQQYKNKFRDFSYTGTCANIQSCLRVNDFAELGDLTHLLYFKMLGLFSFRRLTIEEAILFWLEFIDRIKLKIDYATIHPDKKQWSSFYTTRGIKVIETEECKWTDGEIGGYCTEFFIGDVEIGNIVNPYENCIDAGFGLERLDFILNGISIDKGEALKAAANKIIECGYSPSNTKHGYILRKILRELYSSGEVLDHIFFTQETQRQDKILKNYERLKPKFKNKSKEWWFDTHGINLDEL